MFNTKLLFLLICITFCFSVHAQPFESFEDKVAKEKYVEYTHVNAGILIRKIISNDTSVSYEIGLIVYRKTFAPSDFLENWTHIVFDDKSTLSFQGSISLTYFQVGKHGYCFKHILTKDELMLLQTKRIDYFSVGRKQMDLDRWQPDDIQKAFIKIVEER